MGQQQSKDQLLFQRVNFGNIEGIKALRSQGAGLEWIDSEGKTALIVACMNPQLYNVAKTLIELGANVNVYRPGRHAGTPLHHAAKRGLDQTVKLLLSHGANALIMNDDCHTPLDLARAKGFGNVVRAIEKEEIQHGRMGQQQSKDQLLFQQVNFGNIERIKALRSQGAGLEWIDSDGKTALIVACMNPQLYIIAKTLIELGANVNVYRPGRHAGTPLHHAAKRGLDQTVKLLLSHGANAQIINDNCHTPLDVAKAKGFGNVVRAIEGHLCLFAGWLRGLYRPSLLERLFRSSLLERLAPQLFSIKVWVVVFPCGSHNLARPFKLKLAIYAGPQDPQPSTTIQLWKANLEEPNFNQPDPAAIISDISKSTRIKLAPASESEKHQLQIFCNACKGIPQVMHPPFPFDNQLPTAPPTTVASSAEDEELLAMAISASLQSVTHERPSNADTYLGSEAGASSSNHVEPYNKAAAAISHEASGSPTHVSEYDHDSPSVVHTAPDNPSSVPVPSAPPAADADIGNGPIIYPSIDMSPVDLSSSNVDAVTGEADAKKADETTSSCTICLDALLEGACVPCGHMAGCMTCLSEIKAKSWGCPVCRSRIDQIIRIYAV